MKCPYRHHWKTIENGTAQRAIACVHASHFSLFKVEEGISDKMVVLFLIHSKWSSTKMQQVDLLIFVLTFNMHWHCKYWHEATSVIRRLNFRIWWLPLTQNYSLGQSKLTLPLVIMNPMAAVAYKLLYAECFYLLSQFRLLSIFWIFCLNPCEWFNILL